MKKFIEFSHIALLALLLLTLNSGCLGVRNDIHEFPKMIKFFIDEPRVNTKSSYEAVFDVAGESEQNYGNNAEVVPLEKIEDRLNLRKKLFYDFNVDDSASADTTGNLSDDGKQLSASDLKRYRNLKKYIKAKSELLASLSSTPSILKPLKNKYRHIFIGK